MDKKSWDKYNQYSCTEILWNCHDWLGKAQTPCELL
jgi:hypothetical protein